jgi:hypothetical protein
VTDDRLELIKLKVELAFAQDRLRAAERLLIHERTIWCDRAEDRLYHAEDGTWWCRGTDGHPHRALPPEGIQRIAKALLRFTQDAVRDTKAYSEALRLTET